MNKDDDCEARFEEFVYGGKERTKREMLDFADRSGFLEKKHLLARIKDQQAVREAKDEEIKELESKIEAMERENAELKQKLDAVEAMEREMGYSFHLQSIARMYAQHGSTRLRVASRAGNGGASLITHLCGGPDRDVFARLQTALGFKSSGR